MLEKKIEEKVGVYVKGIGGLWLKFTSPGRRAVPDRIVILHGGISFFMELKRTGEKATPAQLREHKRLEERGQTVFCIDNVEDGIAAVKLMKEGM